MVAKDMTEAKKPGGNSKVASMPFVQLETQTVSHKILCTLPVISATFWACQKHSGSYK